MTEQKLADIIDRLNLGVPAVSWDASYTLGQQLHTLAEVGADETFGPILRLWSATRIVETLAAVDEQKLTIPAAVREAALFAVKWNKLSKS